uniref:Cation-transporting P-type ATPase N-terminal domain-containing protein n=1 Tax=Callorhinchus milii TaxID=7868 RepID=A0A4W3I6Z7_CALMI
NGSIPKQIVYCKHLIFLLTLNLKQSFFLTPCFSLSPPPHPPPKCRRLIFGPNTIDIQIIPLWKLLCKEVLNPFYVFQVFSVCLWISNDYIEYSVAIIIMSLISIAFSVYEVRQVSFTSNWARTASRLHVHSHYTSSNLCESLRAFPRVNIAVSTARVTIFILT